MKDQARKIIGLISEAIYLKERGGYKREEVIKTGVEAAGKKIHFRPATSSEEFVVCDFDSRLLYSFDPRPIRGDSAGKCPLMYIVYGKPEELLEQMKSNNPIFPVVTRF